MQFDPRYVSALVTSLSAAKLSQETLSGELSSGLRVSSESVDPLAAGQAALLGSSISQDDTFVQTAATVQSRMQVSDSALGGVVTQLTSAIALGVQGANGTTSATDLSAIAEQLKSIREDVVSYANTSYQGAYVFAGSKGNTPPYTLDTSTSPATAVYHGDTSVPSVTTAGGQTIQTGLAGSAVFSAAGADVMAALNNLVVDFSGTSASGTAADDVAALRTALANVSTQRSTLDSSLSRMETASTYVQTQETGLKATQSGLVAADPATVATQLSAVETQSQALMSVIVADEKAGLFSYMQ